MEQTALTVNETVTLAPGRRRRGREPIRLRGQNVKGERSARARHVQVPRLAHGAVAATCPLEDRTAERRVFAGYDHQRLAGRDEPGVQARRDPALLAARAGATGG